MKLTSEESKSVEGRLLYDLLDEFLEEGAEVFIIGPPRHDRNGHSQPRYVVLLMGSGSQRELLHWLKSWRDQDK